MLIVALSPLKETGEPKLEPSTLNWKSPEGVPAPGNTTLTFAVNVTDCPKTDGVIFDVTAVVVPAESTVSANADDILLLKFTSPPYSTVME